MALIRLCVTDSPTAAFALARETAAFYRTVPSYSRLQDMEDLSEPAELHLIGTWDRVLDGLNEYAAAGVTDFRLEIAAPTVDERLATREAFTSYLASVPRAARPS
jgi:alkanesulfonate monooxygenase SsuD/methylene tetrahydromethanopterin reductase-like flavin-dependent oxidoreductase (luciferase family)